MAAFENADDLIILETNVFMSILRDSIRYNLHASGDIHIDEDEVETKVKEFLENYETLTFDLPQLKEEVINNA